MGACAAKEHTRHTHTIRTQTHESETTLPQTPPRLKETVFTPRECVCAYHDVPVHGAHEARGAVDAELQEARGRGRNSLKRLLVMRGVICAQLSSESVVVAAAAGDGAAHAGDRGGAAAAR
jgi:hypothetical protein